MFRQSSQNSSQDKTLTVNPDNPSRTRSRQSTRKSEKFRTENSSL